MEHARKICLNRRILTCAERGVKAGKAGDETVRQPWGHLIRVPSGMRLEFSGAFSGNMKVSFQAARSIG